MLLWFLRFGAVDWSQTPDWKNASTYVAALDEAASERRLPYHLRTAVQGTERYFANLEAPLSPAAPLLPWLDRRGFLALHFALYYAAGCVGLLLLKRELALSSFAWTLFATAFLFNGHVAAHLAHGHAAWMGYFLLPWFFVAAVRVARADLSFATLTMWSATLGAMIIGGSWHVFVWCWLFSAALGVASARRALFVLRGSMIIALLAAIRLLPGILTFGAGDNRFIGGFDSLATAVLAIATSPAPASGELGPHEVDTYVGLAGAALAIAGAVLWRHPLRTGAGLLLWASACLAVLSIGDTFERTLFQLPGLVSQRVATRFLIVPVLAMILTGCVRLDRWMAQPARSWTLKALPLAIGALLVTELAVHLAGWRPAGSATAVDAASVLKTAADDPAYVRAVIVGLWVTVITALWLAAMTLVRQMRGPARRQA